MAAKTVTKWRVTVLVDDVPTNHETLRRAILDFNATVDAKTTHVCPHPECGKPWPTLEEGGEALTESEYAWMVNATHPCNQPGRQQDYCCDATRLDCMKEGE